MKHVALPADPSMRSRPMIQDRTNCTCGQRIVACMKPNADMLAPYNPADYYWRHERFGQLQRDDDEELT